MKKKSLNRGLFITLEGGEGSGKTSLLEALYAQLHHLGYHVLTTKAPGGTPLGAKIRDLLLHTKDLNIGSKAELLLFLTDRAQHVEEVIRPYLKKKWIVLCDRFNDSTLAYQGASREILELNQVKFLTEFAVSHLNPDLTFYLDIDPETGLQRAQSAIALDGKASYDRLEKEALSFHKNVREAYLAIASKAKDRIKVLDASLSKAEVFDQACHFVQQKIDLC